MYFKTRLAHSLLFLAIAAFAGYMHYDADSTVREHQNEILDYSRAVDLTVYDQPFTVEKGADAGEVERHLRSADFGECDVKSAADLSTMAPRTFCRRGNALAVKSISPFGDYVFEVNRKSGVVAKIKNASGPVEEAHLPSPVFSAVNLDAEGDVRERVRYDLMLGKEVDPDSAAVKLFVAIEDRRFFQHGGNDWRGLGRAIYRAGLRFCRLTNDEPLQGGSSITEQAAKLLFMPDGDKLWRRIRSMFIAESLERRYTKREILEVWLNLTVMGIERPTAQKSGLNYAQRRESVRGFKAAARVLFNKELSQCSPSELAFLSILPRSPQILPTFKNGGELDVKGNANHRLLDSRRRAALEAYAAALTEAGQEKEAKRFLAARDTPVKFSFNEDDLKGDEALVTYLERDMKKQIAAARQTGSLGEGPMTAMTTIDRGFQRALSARIEDELPEIKRNLTKLSGAVQEPAGGKTARPPFTFEVQVDTVAMSAEDGQLRAFSSLKTAGGRVVPNRSNVNPPSFVASCAKPLITTYGLGEGVITLHTLIRGSQCVSPSGFRFEGGDDRPLPLSDHLLASRNPPFVCVGNLLGIDNVMAKWREIFPGSGTPKQGFVPDPYEILRGLNRPEAELTPTALAEAYTALAGQGIEQNLRVLESVYAGGKQLPMSVAPGRRVFKPEAAALTSSLLRANTRGLGQWRPAPGLDLALKTGSSSNAYWVVLYSPKIVLVVRYLIIPSEKLPDERVALAFSREVERRFEQVFAGNIVRPFAGSILSVLLRERKGWLRGTFSHENVVTVRIDPTRECRTDGADGVPADYVRGTEPGPCPAEPRPEDTEGNE